jgi:dTDP-4-amino-4,6-dideoxygalactose transaminase
MPSLGGPEVRKLEDVWKESVGAEYAVSVNSATSGLYAAIGAVGIDPGDEVIVSPFTMSASATCALVYNAIPVFADIQDDIFCMSPSSIEERITPSTKAIVVVHLFGHPADMDPIMDIAREHNLKVIEDCAQAPLTKYKGRYVGTIGDAGVYSLNYHKHIHTGEGGIVVTNSHGIYDKLTLIRNHGETASTERNLDDVINILGFNYRLTEIQAAIGVEQMKRLPGLLKSGFENAGYIAQKLKDLPGIIPPTIYDGCDHAYYVHPFKFDEDIVGVSRKVFIDAVVAELPLTDIRNSTGWFLSTDSAVPLYRQNIYRKKIAFGKHGCPFTCPHYKGAVEYKDGLCPITELMYDKVLFFHNMHRSPLMKPDLDDLINAFYKVYESREQLKRVSNT